MLKQIGIDLDVNKEIENRRQSFAESPNDILRRTFGLKGQDAESSKEVQVPAANGVQPRVRLSRRRSSYKLKVFGSDIRGGSLKDVLKQTMLAIESKQPGFLEKLSRHRTSRGRHIVARKPDELYPGKPQLVEDCAERLDSRWWFDTNVSFRQTQRYLNQMAETAGIREHPQLVQE